MKRSTSTSWNKVRFWAPILSICLLGMLATCGQVAEPGVSKSLHTPVGARLLENKSFDDSEQARQEILELYKDLRVTDVCDGMDLIGLQDIGLMNRRIRPLWRERCTTTR